MNNPSKAEAKALDPQRSTASKAPRAALGAQKESGKSPVEMPYSQVV